jgi:ATP-dependent DNA ligase
LKERREILGKHMTPIENRILLSDLKTINKKSELKHLINLTIAEGLEGLVLKVNVYDENERSEYFLIESSVLIYALPRWCNCLSEFLFF